MYQNEAQLDAAAKSLTLCSPSTVAEAEPSGSEPVQQAERPSLTKEALHAIAMIHVCYPS